MEELLKLGQHCSVNLDEQAESQHAWKREKTKGRPMSDSGAKARIYQAVKDAHMAHVIKVNLKSELFSYSIEKKEAVPVVTRWQVTDRHQQLPSNEVKKVASCMAITHKTA